jgi:hypothetical protein
MSADVCGMIIVSLSGAKTGDMIQSSKIEMPAKAKQHT